MHESNALHEPPVLDATPPPSEPTPPPRDPNTLYQHDKRPDWGLAVRANARDDLVLFQFEDGGLRKIAASHRHLLRAVDVPADRTENALKNLNSMAGLAMARDTLERDEGEPLLTLEDQIAIFLHRYPEGFSDPRWLDEMRGANAERRLKRHRNPAIAQARELLSESELRQLLARRRFDEIVTRAKLVLEATSLVTAAQLEPLNRLLPERMQAFAEGLDGLLYGEGRAELLLLRFIQPMTEKGKVSWPLATALFALVHAESHVCVRPATFRTQAKWMAPRLSVPSGPDGRTYGRLLSLAESVRGKLALSGHEPADMLDVHDFMWTTLRPAARKVLLEVAPEVEVAPEAPPSGDESEGEAA
jgi:hypothetical protein